MQEKLPWFLEAVPSAECAKGGVGGYNNALQLDSADATGIAGLSQGHVAASSFRTYYTPLNTQQDFIDAYQVSLQQQLTSTEPVGLCFRSHVASTSYIPAAAYTVPHMGAFLIPSQRS